VYGADLSFIHFAPTKISFGVGVVRDVSIEIENLGASRALLVTDEGIVRFTDLAERVKAALGPRCVGVYSDVPPDSSIEAVMRGAARARELGADSLVTVGGGSALDTAKAMAIVLGLGGDIREHEGAQRVGHKVMPHIAIPTTAGTGSEICGVAVIKDHDQHRKLFFLDYYLAPDVALLDPEMTVGLPPQLTAATGMDALSHAIEAIHCTVHQPVADALALHAIRVIREYLPRAVTNGQDLVARGQMLIAAAMANQAASQAQYGLVHAMAHTAGVRYGIHHGHANAVFLPHVMRFNADELADRYVHVAQALGIPRDARSDLDLALAAAEEVARLVTEVGLEPRLGRLGGREEDLPSLAEATLADGPIIFNGKFAMDADLVRGVYQAAL
jgi:alcohol dehydrogenase class IV